MEKEKSLTLRMRPHSFAEVIGQESVISILQRQIATKKWKNVYLFCGSHGCGKTTVARIMANEINNGQGEPIEIDGASNNGVDNIRALIADAQQSSIDCEYKVYIIDEAHQLTRAAWDASLKLIEEPPLNAVFIFCTTNPMKIPGTIMSRVQRFDFKRVDKSVIADRLEFILNEEFESTVYEREALDRIASKADGHVRDAVQLLDKCLDASPDKISLEIVETTLGLVSYESLSRMVNSIIKKETNECFVEIYNLKKYNTDLVYIYDELLSFALDCKIYTITLNTDIVSVPKSICTCIKDGSSIIDKLISRLSTFKPYVNSSNAETFLKTIVLEVCR